MLKSKLIYSLFLINLSVGIVVAGEHTFSVFFELNKYQLTEADKVQIKKVVDSLSNYNINDFKIIGHTDSSADSIYNMHLSNRRAVAVRDYLMGFGFNEKIIHIGFYGEDKPITGNDYEYDRRMNRRAEIRVSHSGKSTLVVAKNCEGKDTVLRTSAGKEVVVNKCEYEELKHCLQIKEYKSYGEFKKGIVIMNKGGQDLSVFGLLQVDLLDGCSKSECFKTAIKIRFPLKTEPALDNHSWALVKGVKMPLKLVKLNNKLFYELELKCPTSWINCNCKKSQKH